MTTSRGEKWHTVQSLEDCMALLSSMRDHCQVARRHLWKKASCGPAFIELTAAVKECDELGAMMTACWQIVYEAATGKDKGEEIWHEASLPSKKSKRSESRPKKCGKR